METKTTVRLDKPPHYLGPAIGTWAYQLRQLKLWLAYRHYRKYLQCYARLSVESKPRTFVADIGCGDGYLLSFLVGWFPQSVIIGFDYDPRLLIRAKQLTDRCCLVQGTAETLPFEDATLAVLIALHLIEHLYCPGNLVSEIARVLVPGGILLVATPNPTGIAARVMKSRWAGWREDHISLRSPKEWTDMLEGAGFTQIRAGTTGLSGIPIFRKTPLALLNYLPLLMFGVLPWDHGEAFVGLFRCDGEGT